MTSVDRFVALAGVYNIELHYLFEAERGVDRISPMAAACATAASFVTNKETDKNVVVRSDSNQRIGWMALRRAWRNNPPPLVGTEQDRKIQDGARFHHNHVQSFTTKDVVGARKAR